MSAGVFSRSDISQGSDNPQYQYAIYQDLGVFNGKTVEAEIATLRVHEDAVDAFYAMHESRSDRHLILRYRRSHKVILDSLSCPPKSKEITRPKGYGSSAAMVSDINVDEALVVGK